MSIDSGTGLSFNISTLMLVTVLVAVVTATMLSSLQLGVLMTILITPAFLRTAFLSWSKTSAGIPISRNQQVVWFTSTLAIWTAGALLLVAGLVFAGFVALLVFCSKLSRLGPGSGRRHVPESISMLELYGWPAVCLIVSVLLPFLLARFVWNRRHAK